MDEKNAWYDEYVSEKSNSETGVLVEMSLYPSGDRACWLVNKASQLLRSRQTDSVRTEWAVFGPAVRAEVDGMMEDLECETEKVVHGNGKGKEHNEKKKIEKKDNK